MTSYIRLFSLILVLFTIGCVQKEDKQKKPTTRPPNAVKAPDFTLVSLEGDMFTLSDFRGKVILLNFWATWCGPCVAEIPNVKRTYDKLHPKGFEIVGISLDSKESALRRFVKEKEMPWPQYFDGKGWKNSISTAHGIRSIPAMWLVDKQGNLADLNARRDLEGKVEELLAAPSPEAN